MITSPTAVGRKFLTRMVNVLVEEHQGPAITSLPLVADAPEVRIVTLTDRVTGAVIQIDESMIEHLVDTLKPKAVAFAERIQAHYDAAPHLRLRVHVVKSTAWVAGGQMTVEANIETLGDEDSQRVLLTCRIGNDGHPALATLEMTDGERRKVA